MFSVIFVLGLAFLLSGLLALTNITQVGLTYAQMIKLHTLPFLAGFPASWVYIGLGLVLIIIAFLFARK